MMSYNSIIKGRAPYYYTFLGDQLDERLLLWSPSTSHLFYMKYCLLFVNLEITCV